MRFWLGLGVLVVAALVAWLVWPRGAGETELAAERSAKVMPIAITFVTDWRAQAEQGGFYQAKAKGFYADKGLDVTIRQGGPNVNVPQLLAAGTVEFGLGSNGFIPINMALQGVPAKAVMASFQKDPQILMTHPRDDVSSIADMKGKPIMISDASIGALWLWLKAEFGFADSQIRKYSGNLAPFLTDPKMITQGYVSSEPYLVEKQGGFEPQVYLLADNGYPGYAAMILARTDLIDKRPDVVQAFVEASIEGWTDYLNGDPAPGNGLIMADNPDISEDVLAQAITKMRDYGLVASGDTGTLGIGAMTAERWQTFYKDMTAAGVYEGGLDLDTVYDLQFVNKGPAPKTLPAASTP